MAEGRAIQAGDAVMLLSVHGQPVPMQGVWLAVKDQELDEDGVARVEIQRIGLAERRRFPAASLWVTDTVEERMANTLMGPGA